MSKSSGNKKKDALLIALRKGNAEKVGKMLDAERDSRDGGDLDPNMDADSARNSILHRAARYGHEDVVKVRNYIIIVATAATTTALAATTYILKQMDSNRKGAKETPLIFNILKKDFICLENC